MDINETAIDTISFPERESRSDADIEQYSEILAPDRLAEYLGSIHWTRLAQKPHGALWADSRRTAGKLASVILPHQEAVDFSARWHEAIYTLVEATSNSVAELAESVASTRADMFFVRVDQSTFDTTIPLRQASKLIENIEKMIRSAAAVTDNPFRAGVGRVSGYVQDFLNDDVRMGHTKRGSFIITVAARHDEFALKENTRDGAEDDAASPSEEIPAFSRRVMTTLSRSLTATKQYISHSEETGFSSFEDAVNAGVRAPFVDALYDIGAVEGVKGIDMSFDWSHALSSPSDTLNEVQFAPEEFDELPTLRERLKREHVPQEETVVGRITKLERTADPEEDAGGRVVLRGDVDGRVRNLHLDLEGPQYEIAIRAHQRREPLAAVGTLVKKGNRWSMEEGLILSQIEIDYP